MCLVYVQTMIFDVQMITVELIKITIMQII